MHALLRSEEGDFLPQTADLSWYGAGPPDAIQKKTHLLSSRHPAPHFWAFQTLLSQLYYYPAPDLFLQVKKVVITNLRIVINKVEQFCKNSKYNFSLQTGSEMSASLVV